MARRVCGKRSRGVPHTRTVGSGRGGDRPASRLAVSGRSSRGPVGNGVTRKVARGFPRSAPEAVVSPWRRSSRVGPGQAKKSQV